MRETAAPASRTTLAPPVPMTCSALARRSAARESAATSARKPSRTSATCPRSAGTARRCFRASSTMPPPRNVSCLSMGAAAGTRTTSRQKRSAPRCAAPLAKPRMKKLLEMLCPRFPPPGPPREQDPASCSARQLFLSWPSGARGESPATLDAGPNNPAGGLAGGGGCLPLRSQDCLVWRKPVSPCLSTGLKDRSSVSLS